MSNQLTDVIMMIRPKSFGFNPETEADNKFQKRPSSLEDKQIRTQALAEFDAMVALLKSKDIEVMVFEDLEESVLPDSVFPNNWISTHEDGSVYTYPMYAPIRRKERRDDIIDVLSKSFLVAKRYSLELFEVQNQFLEGTGSMILDRDYKIAYAALSPRTDPRVLHKFSLLSNYNVILFKAKDKDGFPIYHTNVLMALGQDFVICCMESIEDEKKELLLNSFRTTGKELVEISFEQMTKFAGNMLEVKNKSGKRFLIMSDTAYESLDQDQIAKLGHKTTLLIVHIPTIEKIGGGSARCMIAENFLPRI